MSKTLDEFVAAIQSYSNSLFGLRKETQNIANRMKTDLNVDPMMVPFSEGVYEGVTMALALWAKMFKEIENQLNIKDSVEREKTAEQIVNGVFAEMGVKKDAGVKDTGTEVQPDRQRAGEGTDGINNDQNSHSAEHPVQGNTDKEGSGKCRASAWRRLLRKMFA